MPYDGNGTFTVVYNWTNDYNNHINIRSDRMDTQFSDVATGLSTALTKDGQTTPTADQPMGGFKHLSVANASARNQYAAVGQVQDSSFIWGSTAGGTANAITIAPSPAIAAYAAGQSFEFIASASNTGATTIAVSGLAAKSIKKNVSEALAAGDITTGQMVKVTYDGTNFQLHDVPVSDLKIMLASQIFG